MPLVGATSRPARVPGAFPMSDVSQAFFEALGISEGGGGIAGVVPDAGLSAEAAEAAPSVPGARRAVPLDLARRLQAAARSRAPSGAASGAAEAGGSAPAGETGPSSYARASAGPLPPPAAATAPPSAPRAASAPAAIASVSTAPASGGIVQRSIIQRAETEPGSEGMVTGVSVGESEVTEGPAMNLDELARQVYPLIKRMLAVERERRPYR